MTKKKSNFGIKKKTYIADGSSLNTTGNLPVCRRADLSQSEIGWVESIKKGAQMGGRSPVLYFFCVGDKSRLKSDEDWR